MSVTATSSPGLPSPLKNPALRNRIEELLRSADIQVNGTRPWDMRVHKPHVLERIAMSGSLGLGESYMDGAWDVDQLDEFFTRLLSARLYKKVKPMRLLLPIIREHVFNHQNIKRAWEVGEAHYDLGNEFHRAMLGPSMAYSCAYWKDATDLTHAQANKLDLICRKLQLKPGMRVLDIGCGWGSFMAYAAANYGVECTGITVSRKQAEYAKERFPDLPLTFLLEDYRDLQGCYDRIASIGMFEHVGKKNHRTFMQVAYRCLADDGIFLLHTIGKNERGGSADPWMDKYIFPNAELPSIGHISDAADGLFIVEDLHNFGTDYDRTLMEWHRNFDASWPRFAENMGGRFYRMWSYYLLSCAGAFRARDLQLWQWVLTKHGMPGGYPRII